MLADVREHHAGPQSSATHAPTGATSALVIGATGVVFGDIGTSPLYAMRESLAAEGIDQGVDAILGVASLIFWALTLVVTIKYLTVIMRADNHGEGGILALLALLPAALKRTASGKVSGIALLILVGAGLLYGDGALTPAISVLSAMEGLTVAQPRARAPDRARSRASSWPACSWCSPRARTCWAGSSDRSCWCGSSRSAPWA